MTRWRTPRRGLLVLAACVLVTPVSAADAQTPQSAPVHPDSRVGAIFAGATPIHTCSGSVISSAAKDLVITAAHCVAGPGVGITFSPGYDRGPSLGTWPVSQIYVDPQWESTQDAAHDFAILRISTSPTGEPVGQAAGGGFSLARTPVAGTAVTMTGYPIGLGDQPISCTTPLDIVNGFPDGRCSGFVAGTSGAGMIVGNSVVGVIGGPYQGGCTDDESYSSPFGADVFDLLARAEDHALPDVAPLALNDGC